MYSSIERHRDLTISLTSGHCSSDVVFTPSGPRSSDPVPKKVSFASATRGRPFAAVIPETVSPHG